MKKEVGSRNDVGVGEKQPQDASLVTARAMLKASHVILRQAATVKIVQISMEEEEVALGRVSVHVAKI